MPKIFLIKDRLHQQQQKLLESQKRASDTLDPASLIISTDNAGELEKFKMRLYPEEILTYGRQFYNTPKNVTTSTFGDVGLFKMIFKSNFSSQSPRTDHGRFLYNKFWVYLLLNN